ncbi:hypothetical protein V8G54_020286 [Vigna mungo]|uniref:Uncharacterized protein n=1 Tax=Vigna mungo TaxID=3915 RepID=A0AAQ3NDG3_VIGMU
MILRYIRIKNIKGFLFPFYVFLLLVSLFSLLFPADLFGESVFGFFILFAVKASYYKCSFAFSSKHHINNKILYQFLFSLRCYMEASIVVLIFNIFFLHGCHYSLCFLSLVSLFPC